MYVDSHGAILASKGISGKDNFCKEQFQVKDTSWKGHFLSRTVPVKDISWKGQILSRTVHFWKGQFL